MFSLLKPQKLGGAHDIQRLTGDGKRISRRMARNIRLRFIVVAGICGILSAHEAGAQTFNDASTAQLRLICDSASSEPEPRAQGNLRTLCDQGPTPSSSGVGNQSQPNSALIAQQQLAASRTAEERKRRFGASGDTVTANWGNFGTFLSSGAASFRHRQNDFEQGYNSTIPTVTAGGDYRIWDDLVTGLAFNYFNWNGDIKGGGGFNVNSYSPLFFVNYLPFDGAFANLVLGYARQDHVRTRAAVGLNANPTPFNIGNARGSFNANQYSLSFLSGYDYPIENFTIGPRLGVDVRHWQMDSYQESSSTGLELRYGAQHQTSVQSNLGIYTTLAQSTGFGVVLPYLTASWVHEYANDQRNIRAQFIQATSLAEFTFQTEKPARDWAVIELGTSIVMPNNLQAFVNLTTVQGNRNFESYGGNIGIRKDW